MYRRTAIPVLLISFGITAVGQSRSKQIDAIFESVNKHDSTGAAVGVIEHGKLVYEKGYGSANLEYNIPIVPDTIFHVASVSKQFTAMAVVLLERDGKLSIDDDVHKYLPELPDYGQKITLRNLLQHTSGIRDQWQTLSTAGWSMEDVITQDQILRMLFRQKALNFPPGARYLYSNSGFTMLAEIVTRVSGKPMPQFCDERIFRPLGMTRTHFHQDLHQIVPGRAYSYGPAKGGGFQNNPLNYANAGATSLFTTAGDLLKWLDNFRTAKVGGPAAIARLQEQGVLADGEKINYGLGVTLDSYRGVKRISHNGADAGFRSAVMWFPGEELGIAVASNLGTFNPSQAANTVAELFLDGKMSEAPKPEAARPANPANASDRSSAETLNDYSGVYWSEELETQYTIVVRDGKLLAIHSHHGEFELTPAAKDQFTSSKFFFSEVKFLRDEKGRVNAMTVGGGRVTAIRFDRK